MKGWSWTGVLATFCFVFAICHAIAGDFWKAWGYLGWALAAFEIATCESWNRR